MTNPIFYKRITGSSIQGNAYTVTEPNGTLVIANGGELRLHDGSVAGGNPIGGGGSIGSFGTDKGIGADYASNNPAILFSDDDMIIRTGGTAGHGTIGAMYIASAEELIIGHTDGTLTDATSLGAGDFTDYLYFDTNGIEMTTARGTVQFGYNLEAPGLATHFHINKLNESFDLFFGDDSNYFHLPAGGGSPVIGANDGSSGQKLWTFGRDGSLTLPQSNSGAAVISAGTVGLEFTSNGHALQLGTDGTLIVPGDIKSVADTGDVVIHANNGTQRTWTFGGDGTTIFPNSRIDAKDDLTLRVSGVPNAVTGLTGNPQGGWSGSYTNLSTTGGSGTGLTVNASESGSGYIDTVTIATPGHGYTNGDTITITSGGATAYFTISILAANSWTLSGDGSLTFPDATVQTTAYGGPQIQQTTVTLTPSDLAGLNQYPGKTLVSAAGLASNQLIVVTALEFSLTYNTTPYTTTANLYLNYSGNYLTVAQAIPAGNTSANNNVGMLTSSRNTYRYVQNGMVDGDFPPQQDVILMADNNILDGDSDLRVRVTYIITGLF